MHEQNDDVSVKKRGPGSPILFWVCVVLAAPCVFFTILLTLGALAEPSRRGEVYSAKLSEQLAFDVGVVAIVFLVLALVGWRWGR